MWYRYGSRTIHPVFYWKWRIQSVHSAFVVSSILSHAAISENTHIIMLLNWIQMDERNNIYPVISQIEIRQQKIPAHTATMLCAVSSCSPHIFP